jgi:hypothetical protein
MIYRTALFQRTKISPVVFYILFLVFAAVDFSPQKESHAAQRIPQIADIAIDESSIAYVQCSDKFANPKIKTIEKSSIKITNLSKTVNPFGIKNPENNNKRWKGSLNNGEEYAEFIAPEYAVRASTKILCTLQIEKKSYSLRSVFRKYVASDDIDDYLERLKKDTGISADAKLFLFNEDGSVKDVELFKKLIRSMAYCETGNRDKITFEQIANGIELYHKDFC